MRTFTIAVAALVALASAVAMLVAASASATALCEDAPSEENACGVPYPKDTAFSAKSANATFSNEVLGMTVSCAASTLEGKLGEGPTGEKTALKGSIVSWSFSACKGKSKACGVTVIAFPGFAFNATEKGDGTMNLGEGKGGELLLECEGIHCVVAATSTLDVDGGEAGKATIVASSESLEQLAGGFFCPSKITWSGTFTFSAPEAGKVFVAAKPQPLVRLCKKSGETPCGGAFTYAGGTTVKAALESGKATFKLKVGGVNAQVECNTSTLAGSMPWQESRPLLIIVQSLQFEDCGNCGVTALPSPNFDLRGELEATGGGSGTLALRSQLYGPPGAKITCINQYTCIYEVDALASIAMPVTGGAPAKMSVDVSFDKKNAGSDANCESSELKWQGAYKFTEPKTGSPSEAKMWVVREGV